MAFQIYLSKLLGDGITVETAWHSAVDDLLPRARRQGNKKVDKNGMNLAIHILDLTTEEHLLLVNSGNVFNLTPAALAKTLAELTPIQRQQFTNAITSLGYVRVFTIFTDSAKVSDVLRWIYGHENWAGFRDVLNG